MFRLQSSWADAQVTRADPSRLVRSTFMRGGRALCLVHPLVGNGGSGPVFFGTPTASVRTLLVWRTDRPSHPFFAKLSLPRMLGGERRTLSAESAARCVDRSRLLQAFGSKRGLQLLPETLAVASPRGAFLVRELPGNLRLTPWFALTEHGLLDSLARLHRVSRAKVVREQLIRPFLRAWLSSALDDGWTCDAHAQNLLVERTRSGLLTGRFFVRDLEDVSLDLPFIDAAHPSLRRLSRALDTRIEQDFGEGLEQSLHAFFLSGPIHALGARQVFFEELARVTGQPGKAVRDPSFFRGWVEAQRERRLRAPAVPAKLKRWLRLEQRVNDHARSPRHFAPVDLRVIAARHLPSSQPVFRLPYLEVPLRQVRVRADRVPPLLRRALFLRRGNQRLVRCFFHPMMASAHALDVAEHGQGRETFWATPTASPRSLVVWPEGRPEAAFGLKLSLDVELLRLNRLLEASKLERAVAVSGCVAGVEALREPISVRQLDKEWGSLGRELPPGVGRLIPGFSLFADDGGLPRVISLAGPRARAEQVVAFLERAVFAPLVEAFARLAFGEGLLLDLHQQNVLFDPAMNGRLVIRDLDSGKTDLELRWLRGKRLAPFTRSAGTLAALKLDLGSSHYDEAWAHSVRADWGWLAQHTLRRHAARLGRVDGRRLFSSLDRLMIAAARRWLGDEVVDAELLRAYGRIDGVGELHSLNAMVHAWKVRRRGPPDRPASRVRYQQLAAIGRATARLERGDTVSGSDGVLVTGRRGFALEWDEAGG